MEPNIQNNLPSEPTKPVNSTSAIPTVEKPKNNKIVIWCLSILALLSIITAVIFAYLYFSNNQNQYQPQSQNNNTATTTELEPTTDEETTITDTYIIRDLDEKIGILLNEKQTDSTIVTGPSIYSKDISLFEDGDLDLATRVGHIVNSLTLETLTDEELSAALAQSGNIDGNNGISGEKVRARYKEVFGKEIDEGATASFYCGNYQYQSQYDFYYSATLGCGGTTALVRFYYKSNYTTNGDKAYVYVSTAGLNSATNNVYCDVVGSMKENPKICATAIDTGDGDDYGFTLDETNYQDFAQYRFVFNKADDGTYYFEKVEKL